MLTSKRVGETQKKKQRRATRKQFSSKGSVMLSRGKFIVLEGLDGAGTTTLTDMIRQGIVAEDLHCCKTREPYSDELTPVLRRFIRGEFENPGWRAMSMLFSADRIIHCRDIDYWLDLGMHVVCDRYVGSTIAYQSAMAEAGYQEEVMRIISGAFSVGILRPDLTIFLKADAETCAKRRANREGQEDFYEKLPFQKKVEAQYDIWLNTMAHAGPGLIVAVDATQPVEKVYKDCMSAVRLVIKEEV